MGNEEENTRGVAKGVVEKKIKGTIKKTIVRLLIGYCCSWEFILIIILTAVIWSVFFVGDAPGNELDGGPSNIPADKEGSVGYFHDIIKEKTGKPATVGSGCNDGRPGGRRHNGYDFAFPKGTPVYSVYPGEVIKVDRAWYKGVQAAIYVKKDKPDKDGAQYYSYGHLLQNIPVSNGQKIEQGTLLGYVYADHLDMKKSASPALTPPTRICNGGTTIGLPSNKYEAW